MKTLHGFIQKALIDAIKLPWRIRQNPIAGEPEWEVEVYRPRKGEWETVRQYEFQEDAEDFLVGKLTQEDR